MSLLVYAFEPFGRNKQNISYEVLKKLHKREGLKRVVFPIEFNSQVFIRAVDRAKPSVILGLGQYPRGRKIRIEKRAVNQRKTKAQLPRSIAKSGSASVGVTLKLHPDNQSWISYNAGKYVCNYSIYVLLTSAKTKDIPLAFIHIPKSLGVSKSTKFVEAKIDEILGL